MKRSHQSAKESSRLAFDKDRPPDNSQRTLAQTCSDTFFRRGAGRMGWWGWRNFLRVDWLVRLAQPMSAPKATPPQTRIKICR
eukprot:12248352-Alexandrium_andersonii.AAC.2